MTNEKAPAGQGEGSDQNLGGAIMSILPDTEETRHLVREWAWAFSTSQAFGSSSFQPPDWPPLLTPWWAREVEIDDGLGGEASVVLKRDFGSVVVSTLITVVVSTEPAYEQNHPGQTIGDYFELDGGKVEATITGPHEGMALNEATDLFDGLARAISTLREIGAGL